MKTAEELKVELMEMEGQRPAPADGTEQIANDDPEMLQLFEMWNGPCIADLPSYRLADTILSLYGIDVTTKPGAKKMLARCRKETALQAVISNDALPRDQRITAVQSWRGMQPRPEVWQYFSDVDLIERLTPHPDLDRLKELSKLVCDARLPNRGDWKAHLKEMRAAIQEFQELRGKHPKRYAPVMLSLESLAGTGYEITGDVQTDEVVLRERRAYARELQNGSAA